MLYLNEEIPWKFLNNYPIVPHAATICTEFHQLKRQRLLLGCYKPPIQSDLESIASIPNSVNFYLQKFENVYTIGDSNMTTENTHLNDLCKSTRANLLPIIKSKLHRPFSNQLKNII